MIHVRSRGYLPHWERNEAIYFVTFGAADSLPKELLEKMASERDSLVQTAAQIDRDLTSSELRHLDRLKSIDRFLDSGAGACQLARPDVAEIVTKAFRYFDGARYMLFAWCIMPNHVHVVVRVFPHFTLAQILHSWKSFSAKKIDAVLGSSGRFWRREYYDHLVRNEADLNRVVDYVEQNPVKAGLANWPHVWVLEDCEWAGETPALRQKST